MKNYILVLTLVIGILSEVGFSQSLSVEKFSARRQTYLAKTENGVTILKGGELALRNGDDHYKFRQTSDFYYLTGYEKPGAVALLTTEPDSRFILFVPEQKSYMIAYEGKQPSPSEMKIVYGVDTAFFIKDLDSELRKYLKKKSNLYYKLKHDKLDETIINILDSYGGPWPDTIIDPFRVIHEQRLIKQPEEIKLLKKAIDITGDAHLEVMKAIEPGMNEYEINAIVDYIYKKNGSPGWGFTSIAASGRNSCILHYQDNNQPIESGDMMVLDIGAEFGYYSADITRSFPVNGKFTNEQKTIYELVLKSHLKAIDAVKPGASIADPNNACLEVIKEGLFKMGLITDKESKWQTDVWLPYKISHWLGLDAHDVGKYRNEDGTFRTLEPGMVFTIEPGLYFGEDILDLLPLTAGKYVAKNELEEFIKIVRPNAQKYKNIGVRIEDDILVTKNGHKVLSDKTPKSIKEIEKIMSQTSYLNR